MIYKRILNDSLGSKTVKRSRRAAVAASPAAGAMALPAQSEALRVAIAAHKAAQAKVDEMVVPPGCDEAALSRCWGWSGNRNCSSVGHPSFVIGVRSKIKGPVEPAPFVKCQSIQRFLLAAAAVLFAALLIAALVVAHRLLSIAFELLRRAFSLQFVRADEHRRRGRALESCRGSMLERRRLFRESLLPPWG